MDLFNPDFARTLRPGLSRLPEAEADIFFTLKSSMTTTTWFLLMVVVAL
jgi:hypothetical protein